MPPLPDGTFHPHQVRIEHLSGELISVTLQAVPPDGEPFMVSGWSMLPGGDLDSKVDQMIQPVGLQITTWSTVIEDFGPREFGLHRLVLIGATEELPAEEQSWPPMVSVANVDDPLGPPAWEGRPKDAHKHLAPGRYRAVDEDGDDFALVVESDRSRIEGAIL